MRANESMSLNTRLIATILATIIALLVLFAGVLYTERSLLLKDRQEKVRNLVEVAYGVIAQHEKSVTEGKMTREAAQASALAVVRNMRYDSVEYFWVNDMTPKILMHAAKPDLEGKDMSALKDPNGKFLFNEFVAVVKKDGKGFVDYFWPKAGETKPVAKISYVMGFEPWGWIVGSGIYLDDVDRIFREEAAKFLLWGLIVAAVVAFPLILMRRSLLRLLGGEPSEAVAVARRIAAGDLGKEVFCAAGDTESLLAGMKDMQGHLREMISTTKTSAESIALAAQGLSASVEQAAQASDKQSASASDMAAAIEEMSVSIDLVRDHAREARDIAVQSGEDSRTGGKIIHSTTDEMHQVENAVNQAAITIRELEGYSSEISTIIKVIRDVADQTNMLALNAAIEAARAGEQGRGFAVVADEVRKLAERTAESTHTITTVIGKVQEGARRAASEMEGGVARVAGGVEKAHQAGESINGIQEGANRVAGAVSDIRTALDEQSTTTQAIARNVETIAQMAEENSASVRQNATEADHLRSLAANLNSAIARFKL